MVTLEINYDDDESLLLLLLLLFLFLDSFKTMLRDFKKSNNCGAGDEAKNNNLWELFSNSLEKNHKSKWHSFLEYVDANNLYYYYYCIY